ncbi:MAG TPA: hypothetical protein VNN79_22335 [Actinomycetota bacterium]|nr:hypothetical protein [Actinomycetota bacterium]
MRKEWTISTRGVVALMVGVIAAVLLLPMAAGAVSSSPVFITSDDGGVTANVDGNGLWVTANPKNPLPVQGVVGAVPAPGRLQLLRRVDVPASAIVAALPNVFHSGDEIAITSVIFANNSGANANVSVFGYGIGGASSCGSALPSPLGPDLVVASVPAHDSVVVPLPAPAEAPHRTFPANWCLGAAQFGSPAAADVQVTVQAYRL